MGACRWCYTFPLHVNTEAYSNVLLNRLVWTPTSRQELVELVPGSHVPAPPRRDGARQRSPPRFPLEARLETAPPSAAGLRLLRPPIS